METSFIIILLIAILLIYLIFKFIKKVVVAAISAILVVLLLFGGVIGLAVYDVKSLSEQTDFTIDLIYQNQGEYLLGTEFSIENSEINPEKITSISEDEFNALEPKKISKSDNKFVVILEKEILEKAISLNTFNFEFLAAEDLPEEIKLGLTKQEVFDLIESKTATDDLINILFEKNEIADIIATALKPALKTTIETELEKLGITINQAIFLSSFQLALDENELDLILLLESYKDDDTKIYPDRFSFSLVRMLPVSFLSGALENFTTKDQEEPVTE